MALWTVMASAFLTLASLGETPAQQKQSAPNILKTEDGIPYVSTGVGYDSRINLPHFSLRLVFSTRTGKYIADVDLEILHEGAGKPTRIHSDGPWLAVDLPPGRYKVTARTVTGRETSKTFLVSRGRVSVVKLEWAVSEDEI